MELISDCFMLLCIFCVALDAEFKCFTNESNMIMYANNVNKQATLPTIRLMQGYYPSQYALQYAAYVYLREKVGLNVTFYPTNDPNALSTLAASGSLLPAYPKFYYAWLSQNRYDLLLEMWDTMESSANGQDYYLNGSVKYGGLSEVWSESGIFVPSYLYQNSPNWFYPQDMISNEIMRRRYIDAATLNSSIDWIEYAQNQSINGTYTWDTPTYDKPSIFICCSYYALAIDSARIVSGALNGSWNLVVLGSESKLSEFVSDLYPKRLPFVLAHYSPHPDFYKLINATSAEYTKFERLSLPRNPSNTQNDECFISGNCSFPITGLRKIGNPLLEVEFPEMIEFLSKYKMTANDVNMMMGVQYEISNNPNSSIYQNDIKYLTEHEIWQYSVCEWMKTADLDHWEMNIIRYDCSDGSSMVKCVSLIDDSTSRILLILGGVVGLIVIIFIIYKLSSFCIEFQREFGVNINDSKQIMLFKKEKRRLFLSIFTDFMSFVVGALDCTTDILSTITIVYAYKNDNNSYSRAFVIIYFSLAVITLFVSSIHMIITLKNILNSFSELKHGILLKDKEKVEEEEEEEEELMKKEINKLLFKKQILIRNIQKDSVTIFVALCEDLPFLILNVYGLSNTTKVGINIYLMGSLICNCVSFGYKICIFKEFFSNLQERNSISDSLTNLSITKKRGSSLFNGNKKRILSQILPLGSQKTMFNLNNRKKKTNNKVNISSVNLTSQNSL